MWNEGDTGTRKEVMRQCGELVIIRIRVNEGISWS